MSRGGHLPSAVTRIASKGFDKEHLEHLGSSANLTIAHYQHFTTPTMTDGHFEISLTEKRVHYGNGKEDTEGVRCTYCTSFAL